MVKFVIVVLINIVFSKSIEFFLILFLGLLKIIERGGVSEEYSRLLFYFLVINDWLKVVGWFMV